MSTHVLLKLPAVSKQTTLSKSHIYDLIQRKSFPAPVKLTDRSVAWLESEVNTWIETAIVNSRGGAV